MSKLLSQNKAFQKNTSKKNFNIVAEQMPGAIAFDPQPLSFEESSEIKDLLLESEGISDIGLDKIAKDAFIIEQLTSELKGIGRQGVFLMGERVCKAKEILKSYKDGTFTRWLIRTFGTRKTGYNALSYYELCKRLPAQNIREKFMRIPLSAAYNLASREGSLNKKISLIKDFAGKTQKEIISEIKKQFPTQKRGGRKEIISVESIIESIYFSIQKLEKRKVLLSNKNKERIRLIGEKLKGIMK